MRGETKRIILTQEGYITLSVFVTCSAFLGYREFLLNYEGVHIGKHFLDHQYNFQNFSI